MTDLGEQLRQCMRHWPTGVTIVTSQFENHRHGMTVNSFTSISLEPPVVSVTLADNTRTSQLLLQSEILGITILSENQAELSDRFAGRIPEDGDRFAGLETFSQVTGAPFLAGGLAYLDCRLRASHPLGPSTLFLLDVVAARPTPMDHPLVYFNRGYHKLP
jgi:flavin reductase (DIM6/NTAB) family NADH-FMN oxidoreductase RutF